jgi:hypothetical protein
VYAQKNPQRTKNAEELSISIMLLVRTNASTVDTFVFCCSGRSTGYKELKKDTDAEIVCMLVKITQSFTNSVKRFSSADAINSI